MGKASATTSAEVHIIFAYNLQGRKTEDHVVIKVSALTALRD